MRKSKIAGRIKMLDDREKYELFSHLECSELVEVWLDCIENHLKSIAVKRGGRNRTTDMRGLSF